MQFNECYCKYTFFLNAVYLQRNYICNGNKEDS